VDADLNVNFYGRIPDNLKVGDKLQIAGVVTVKRIGADLVDITALGTDPDFALGGISVDLVANRLNVNAD
jgi:hypothetical protein